MQLQQLKVNQMSENKNSSNPTKQLGESEDTINGPEIRMGIINWCFRNKSHNVYSLQELSKEQDSCKGTSYQKDDKGYPNKTP